MSAAALRHARDASTAHLEAVLKVDGARYLRLAYLRDKLGKDSGVELKSGPGMQSQLWLDLAHRVTMEPHAKTYRLSRIGVDTIDVMLETESLDEALVAARVVLAHRSVEVARAPADVEKSMESQWITMLYVWLTGVVTGIAVLALYIIHMKKLPF